MTSSERMKAIVAARFAPLNFADVNGFPNLVPAMDIWGDCLPRFRESKGDNPLDHLIRFHQCMVQLDICHEDVLMKMFVFSLEGDAREWYRSLPPSSISSLKEFHRVFHHRCEKYYAQEILLEGCEKFHLDIPNDHSFISKDESLSIPAVQEEDLQDRVDENIDEFEEHIQRNTVISSDCHDEKYERDLHDTIDNCEDCMAVDVLGLVSDAHVVCDLHEESVIEDDCSQIIEDVSYDMFPAMIEKKELKTSCLSLQDTEVVCSPIYDEYADEIDQISISNDVDLSSSPLIYDSYGSDLEESFSLPIKEQYRVEVNHSVFTANVLSSEFYHEYDLLHQINGQYDCVENFVVEYDTFLKDSKVMYPEDKEQIACGNSLGLGQEHHGTDTGKQLLDFKQQGIVIHKFYDPIALWMDSRFSVRSCITEFCIIACSSKYEPVVVFLLPILFLFHNVCCIQLNRSSNSLLEIYFWKFVYT